MALPNTQKFLCGGAQRTRLFLAGLTPAQDHACRVKQPRHWAANAEAHDLDLEGMDQILQELQEVPVMSEVLQCIRNPHNMAKLRVSAFCVAMLTCDACSEMLIV